MTQDTPPVNIHTHRKTGMGIELLNWDNLDEKPTHTFVSAGLHPWKIGKCNHLHTLDTLTDWCANKSISAIGEIGVDHCTDIPLDMQKELFSIQLQLAQTYGMPVIIHCVKAYSDIAQVLNQTKPTMPIIFHSYSGSLTTAQQLMRHNVFFSFGKKLTVNRNVQNTFLQIPYERIFLETDTDTTPIANIYNFASQLASTSTDVLEQVIFNNLNSIFSNKWTTVGQNALFCC